MEYHFIAHFMVMKCSHFLRKNMYCKYMKTKYSGKYLDRGEDVEINNFVNYILITLLRYVMIDMWRMWWGGNVIEVEYSSVYGSAAWKPLGK